MCDFIYIEVSGMEEWKKDRKVDASGVSAYRIFDMDLTSHYPKWGDIPFWEWVGPRTGILVNWVGEAPEDADYPLTLDGSYLFGNHTFGRKGDDIWQHGYQPLATLDVNKDSRLTADELSKVWIWVDANGDAKVDKGEMVPSSTLVTSINTSAKIDAAGNAEAPKGAVLKDGTVVPTWDWWSQKYEYELNEYFHEVRGADGELFVDRIADRPVRIYPPNSWERVRGKTYPSATYYWGSPGSKAGGYLRFVTLGEDVYVITARSSTRLKIKIRLFDSTQKHYEFFMAKVEPVSDTVVKWTLHKLFNNWLDHNVVTIRDGQLFGDGLADYSQSPRNKLPNDKYTWVAEAVPEGFNHGKSLPIYLALTSFSEEMLMDALRKQNPEAKMIQVIKPVDELTPPPVIKAKFPGIKNK